MIIWLAAVLLRACVLSRRAWWFDLALFLAGMVFIWRALPDFMPVMNWPLLPAYLLLGLILFTLSVMLTTRHPIRYLEACAVIAFQASWHAHRTALWRSMATAITEEVVWRMVLQTVLVAVVGSSIAVIAVAFSFSCLHRKSTRGFGRCFIDLFVFSLCLGWMFHATQDILAVVIVHAMRNYLIGLQTAARSAFAAGG